MEDTTTTTSIHNAEEGKRKRGRPPKLPILVNVDKTPTPTPTPAPAPTPTPTPTPTDFIKPLASPIVMGLTTHNPKLSVSKADNSAQHLLSSKQHVNMETLSHKGEVTNLKRKRGRPPKLLFDLNSPNTNEPDSLANKIQKSQSPADDDVQNPVSVLDPLAMTTSTPCPKTLCIAGDQFIRLGHIRRLSLGKRHTARIKSRRPTKISSGATLELANTIARRGKKLISIQQPQLPASANFKNGAECANNSSSRIGVGEDSDNGTGRHVAVAVTSNNACDDDKPLSAWLEGAHSLPASTDASQPAEIRVSRGEIEVPPCDQPKENTQDAKDKMLCGDTSRDDDFTNTSDESLIQSTAIVPMESPELPFAKSSLVWGVIESMEILKRIPQKPHFLPLYNCKEECREGLAIGSMVTFTSLAERIYGARFDDPKSVYEGYLEALVDLEELGFNVAPVRELLYKLISIKSRCEQALNTYKEIGSQIMERKHEKSKMDDEIAELEKKITELKEKQTLAVSTKETKDAEIALLQLSMVAVKAGLDSGQEEFEKTTASLW